MKVRCMTRRSAAALAAAGIGVALLMAASDPADALQKVAHKSAANRVSAHQSRIHRLPADRTPADAARTPQREEGTFRGTYTLHLEFEGIESRSFFGDPDNEVLEFSLSPNARVIGISWDVALEAFETSWLSEMRLYVTNANVSAGVSLQPGIGVDDAGQQSFSSDGIVNLPDQQLDFAVGADGILRFEFWEFFDDIPEGPDGIWTFGTMIIEYIDAPTPCMGDLNDNHAVDVSDMLMVLSSWGANPGDPADINGDGVVDVSDMLTTLAHWGPCPGEMPVGACCMDNYTCAEQMGRFACASAGGTYSGNYTTCSSCADAPTGQACSSALPLSPGQNSTCSAAASAGTNAPPPPCDDINANHPATWYAVTGSGTDLTVSVNTGEAGPGSAAAAYCGYCPDLLCVASASQNSTGINPLDADVSWCAADGQTYYIAVWSLNGASDAEVSLTQGDTCSSSVSCGPTNDDCAAAIDITGNINGDPVHGDTAGAPRRGLPPGSPTCHWASNPENVRNIVWYKFIAPSQDVTITTCNSQGTMVDTVMALYSGSCGDLLEVACGDDECGGPTWFSTITATDLKPGQIYYLMIANPGFGTAGTFSFEITAVPARGACCIDAVCYDDMHEANCQGEFHIDRKCNELPCIDCPIDAVASCDAQFIYDSCQTDLSIVMPDDGVIAWAQRYDAGDSAVIHNIATTYGAVWTSACKPVGWAIMTDTDEGPGSVIDQGADQIAWEALGSDKLQVIETGKVAVSGKFFIVIWYQNHLNDLEAVLDTSSEAPTSNDVWLLLHPGITFDQFNPEQPAEKLNLTKAGQPGVWMLRANQ